MSLISNKKEAISIIFTESIYKIQEKISYSVFNFEGENNRNILIVIEKDLEIHEREFLEKILTALKLNLRDTAILSINQFPNIAFIDIQKYFSPKKIISFGILPKKIGINSIIPIYQTKKLESCSFLLANNLKVISEKEDEKKELWQQLKNMFNV